MSRSRSSSRLVPEPVRIGDERLVPFFPLLEPSLRSECLLSAQVPRPTCNQGGLPRHQWHFDDEHLSSRLPQKARIFYEQRFRDEFEPAFRAWLNRNPFTEASAPDSPFDMPEYVVAAESQAAQLTATADATAEAARQYVQRATNYVLGVVLFAVALFFAGISPRLSRPRLRISIFVAGVAIFGAATAWIATFPSA